MVEHHLRVSRSARYFTLGAASSRTKEIWIVCHGYGQLASRFLRHFASLDDGTRVVAAPEALSRFYIDSVGTHHTPEARIGAAWMTREDREHEIRDYVAYLDALAGNLLEGMDRSAVRLVAFGFSQGVATVTRWAARGGTRVDRMILWAGSLPEDLVLAEHRDRFGAAPVTCVFGDHDEFFNDGAIARQQGRMRDAGIPFAFVRFGGGHTIDPQTLERLATPAAFGR